MSALLTAMEQKAFLQDISSSIHAVVQVPAHLRVTIEQTDQKGTYLLGLALHGEEPFRTKKISVDLYGSGALVEAAEWMLSQERAR